MGSGFVVLMAVAIGAGCRLNFDPHDEGLGNVAGLMVSEPGELVFEDGRYDAASGIGGGYAVAWAGYPAGARAVQLRFATVSEGGELVIAPQVVEVLGTDAAFVRLFAGDSAYLLIFRKANEDTVVTVIDADGSIRSRTVDSSLNNRDIEVIAVTDGFVMAINSGSRISTRRYDRFGEPSAGDVIAEPAPISPTQVGVVSVGSNLVVTWADLRTGAARIWRVVLDPVGQPLGPPTQLYEDGRAQGRAYVAGDGADGFYAVWDGFDSYPELVMRFASDGVPAWTSPLVVYDEPVFHDTIDIASSPQGRLAMSWVTEIDTLLTNVEYASIDREGGAVPVPRLLSDPEYTFCYPEVAVGQTGFGTAFVGHVGGSLGLFLAIVRD